MQVAAGCGQSSAFPIVHFYIQYLGLVEKQI